MAATRADDIRGKSVIELSAGTGPPGLGAKRVVLTDVKALLPGMERNVEANGLGERVEVRKLVWGSAEAEAEEEEEEEFDVERINGGGGDGGFGEDNEEGVSE